METFTRESLPEECRKLAAQDKQLESIIDRCGYPDFWHRDPGFPALVHIILEQQVSLASAKAAYDKLASAVNEVTPDAILALSDDDLRGCGFSRQKSRYVRDLSSRVASGELDVDGLAALPDDEVRRRLTTVVGVGDWTVDVYLLLSLHRLDVFAPGDLAVVRAMTDLGFIQKGASKEVALEAAERFRPRRSIFAMLLWRFYLEACEVPSS